jgi:hypothetical protein
MNDLLFVSDITVDPNAMAKVANLFLESTKFHAPQYAWAFSRYRAIGDITLEANDTKAVAGSVFKEMPISVATNISITLATETRNGSLIVSFVALVRSNASCQFYSVGNFTCGAASGPLPADTFTLETMNDAIQQTLAELAGKAPFGLAALNAALVASKPQA